MKLTTIKEKPIIVSGALIPPILDGSKTQTRRVVVPQPTRAVDAWSWDAEPGEVVMYHEWPHRLEESSGRDKRAAGELYPRKIKAPYKVGMKLWVRETWAHCGNYIRYAATDDIHELRKKRPSIFMPRWASRITLEVTEIRVQQIKDITEEDAKAEGLKLLQGGIISEFAVLWNSLNKKRGYGWEVNPWVFAYTFKRIKP